MSCPCSVMATLNLTFACLWRKKLQTGAKKYKIICKNQKKVVTLHNRYEESIYAEMYVPVVADIEIDREQRRVRRHGELVHLTGLEYGMLDYLSRHANCLCTREQILDNVWGTRFRYDTGTIDVHLNALRRKLGCERGYPIETIRGAGLILHTGESKAYSLTIQSFVADWLTRHNDLFRRKGLTPSMHLDPFVSELTMSPEELSRMLDGILAALLPSAKPGTISITSRLNLSHFSLTMAINDTVNELRIPLGR